MATPTLVRIVGTYLGPDGVPARGSVRFSIPGFLHSETTADVVVPLDIVGTLTDGVLDVEVPATDDPGWSPEGWTYDVVVRVDGLQATFALAVPYDSPGGELDLSDVLPSPATGGDLYAGVNHEHPALLAEDDAAALYLPLIAPEVEDSTLTVRRSAGGAIRLRSTGGAIDFDKTSADIVVSSWANNDFSGDQTGLQRWRANGTTFAGLSEFGPNVYSGAQAIDGADGVAALGAKNGLTNLRFCGYKGSAGAPSTGTWSVGDLIMDSTKTWYRCTAAGTPGTWV